jgi:hypothetical protein
MPVSRCRLPVLSALLAIVPAVFAAAPPTPGPMTALVNRLGKGPIDADALTQLVRLAGEPGLRSVPSDPARRIAPVLRARQVLDAWLAKRPASDRQAVEKHLAALFRRDRRTMRVILLLLGAETAGGRQFRLERGHRLAGTGYSPVADLLLQEVRRSGDATLAARAVLELARMHSRPGSLRDALHYYRVLDRDFPKVRVEAGQTGADVFADLAADKRFMTYFDSPPAPLGRSDFRFREERGTFEVRAVCTLSQAGEKVPFFARHTVAVDAFANRLLVRRFDGSGTLHTLALKPAMLHSVLGDPGLGYRARLLFQSLGHLVLFSQGARCAAFDPIGGRLLWEKSLQPAQRGVPDVSGVRGFPDGSVRIVYREDGPQWLGVEYPLTPERFLVVTHDGLQALDPLTGAVLWTRSDVKAGSRLLQDGETVLVVAVDEAGKALATAAYRLSDGVAIPAKDFSKLYNTAHAVVGGRLLLVERGKEVRLRLVEPVTGRNVWDLMFPKGSRVVESLVAELTGVVEPGGPFHLIEAATGRKRWKSDPRVAEILPRKAGTDKWAIRMVADAAHVYLATEEPDDGERVPGSTWEPLFRSSAGLTGIPVHGNLWALDRSTGKVPWFNLQRHQMLLVGGEAEQLPFLVFAAQSTRRVGTGQLRREVKFSEVRIFAKHNGKLAYINDNWPYANTNPIEDVQGDPERRTRLLGPRLRVEVTIVPRP